MGSARVTVLTANEDSWNGASFEGRFATYGTAREYTSGELGNWETDNQRDLTSDNKCLGLEIFDDAVWNDEVEIAGATVDSTRFRMLRSAASEGHDGTTNTGAQIHRNNAASIWTLRLNEQFLQAQDLIVKLTNNTGSTSMCFRMEDPDQTAIGILVFDCVNSGGSVWGWNVQAATGVMNVIMCLADTVDNDGFILRGANTKYVYNCIARDATLDGFTADEGTVILKNCLATENGGNDFNGTYDGASTNNASEDATAATLSIGVDITETDMTTIYENISGNDFHTKSTATTQVRNAGANLSADGNFAFNDDINDGVMGALKAGQSWGQWDIGYNESEVGGLIQLIMYHRQMIGAI